MTPVGFILYALIALVPAVFFRGASNIFEFPKTELLATGALILCGIFAAGELARFRAVGFRAWIAVLPERAKVAAKRDPLGAAIALFLLSAVVSSVASIRVDSSIFGAHGSEAGLKTAFATAVIYFASRSLASDPRHLDRIARAAAVGLAIAVSYALLQLTGLDPFEWTWSATLGGLRRVPGTLGHANHLGAWIAITLPLVASLISRGKSRNSRLPWIVLGTVSLPVLAATLSRGAWVAFAAGLVTYGLMAWGARRGASKRGGRRLVFAAVALAFAAFLAPLFTQLRPVLLGRLRQITDVAAPSTQSRVQLWRAGIRMAADHPIAGVGTDGYLAAFPRYRTPEYWRVEWNGLSAKAHNELVQIAATQGVLGLLACFLVVFLAGRAVLRASRLPDAAIRAGAAAAAGTLVAFAIQDLASFTVASTGTLAAAVAGWAGRSGGAPPHAPGSPGRAASSAGPTRAIGLLAAGTVWVFLVLLPWLADTAAARAMLSPIASPPRALHLRRALSLAPYDGTYATELGRTLLAQAFAVSDTTRRQEELALARAAFDRAVRISPKEGELRALLARTMAAQAGAPPGGDALAHVRVEFGRAIALEPENPNVLELATQGYLELGLTKDARVAALRCAGLFPDYAMPIADLGVAALLEGRAEAAADTLTLALQRNWHGEEAAAMAAKSNYVAALRELRLRDVMKEKP
ncbi:MAG TPA: O-antigen ligase family protein [Candidatus Eisenbacteria bacterium]